MYDRSNSLAFSTHVHTPCLTHLFLTTMTGFSFLRAAQAYEAREGVFLAPWEGSTWAICTFTFFPSLFY